MKIQKIYTITYSPTRTSFKIAKAVAEGIGTEIVSLDITRKSLDNIFFENNSIAIIAAPVYGGKVAPVAKERLKQISVQGMPAILIAVYGNRDYEGAVCQLDELVTSQGFRTIAVAAFIGEHSYSDEKNPIAKGRPDTEDLKNAVNFGQQVRRKLETAEEFSKIDVRLLEKAKCSLFSKLKFIFFVLKLRRSKITVPKSPVTNISLCQHCGACVKVCPTAAIPAGNETWTDAQCCTRCCACVKVCTRKARSYDTPFAPALSSYFSKRKEPSLLL